MSALIPFNKRNTELRGPGFDDFYNMLDDFFSDTWPLRRSLARDTFKVDVQDTDTEYLIEAELPGVAKEEVNLRLEEGKFTISVSREENKNEEQKNYIHKERRYCSMSRSIYLADAAADGVKAKMENGILSIRIPKQLKTDHSVEIEIE